MLPEFASNMGISVYLVVAIIIVAGFFQGFINTIAGAGTVITYSLFVAMGMPATVTNGTVRVGVLMQTLVSSFKFYRGNKLDLKKGLILAVPIVAGSIAGAGMAVNINKDIFEILVGIMLLILLITMFLNPKKWIEGRSESFRQKNSVSQYLLFLLIGFYGGFIHIGVGIFLLSALVLNAGYDVVKANAIKVFLVLMYIPIALIIFIISDQIDLLVGLIAAIGNLLGGFFGTNLAIKKGAGFVRILVMFIIIVFVMHLFGVV